MNNKRFQWWLIVAYLILGTNSIIVFGIEYDVYYPIISELSYLSTAVHEVGHMIIGWLSGSRVESKFNLVSFYPNWFTDLFASGAGTGLLFILGIASVRNRYTAIFAVYFLGAGISDLLTQNYFGSDFDPSRYTTPMAYVTVVLCIAIGLVIKLALTARRLKRERLQKDREAQLEKKRAEARQRLLHSTSLERQPSSFHRDPARQAFIKQVSKLNHH